MENDQYRRVDWRVRNIDVEFSPRWNNGYVQAHPWNSWNWEHEQIVGNHRNRKILINIGLFPRLSFNSLNVHIYHIILVVITNPTPSSPSNCFYSVSGN